MNGLYPIFFQNVFFGTNLTWGNIVNADAMYLKTDGTLTTNTDTLLASSIHGPFEVHRNGGADVLELVGYAKAGNTLANTVTSSTVSAVVWGESLGQQAHRRAVAVTANQTFSSTLTTTYLTHSIGGYTVLPIHGSYTIGGTVNYGQATRYGFSGGPGAPVPRPFADSFPFIADGTIPTTADTTQFSGWLNGPGFEGDTNGIIQGTNLGTGPIARIWMVIRFTFATGGTLTAPNMSEFGLALVGYRACDRTDPRTMNVMGVKPEIVQVA